MAPSLTNAPSQPANILNASQCPKVYFIRIAARKQEIELQGVKSAPPLENHSRFRRSGAFLSISFHEFEADHLRSSILPMPTRTCMCLHSALHTITSKLISLVQVICTGRPPSTVELRENLALTIFSGLKPAEHGERGDIENYCRWYPRSVILVGSSATDAILLTSWTNNPQCSLKSSLAHFRSLDGCISHQECPDLLNALDTNRKISFGPRFLTFVSVRFHQQALSQRLC